VTSPNTVALGDVASFVRGINFKPEDVVPVGTPGSVACMRTKNVQAELDLKDVWGVAEAFVRRDEQVLRYGDVLVSSANSWNLVGKCCWVPELPWRASFGGFVSVLRATSENLDSRYLYRWFSSEPIQLLLRSFGQKTTNISNLNIARCLALRLPLPALGEQRRLAAILDQAESLRAQRHAAIAQLDGLEQALFEDMFGEPEANPKQWPRCALAQLVGEGFQNGLYKHANEYGSGTPILRIDAFYDGVVTSLNRLKRVRLTSAEIATYGLRVGDIVINRVNSIEYLGKSALIPSLSEPVVFESNMMRFTVNPEIALPVYIAAFLQSGYIRRQIGTSAKQAVNQASINQRDVSAFQINVPPLSQQQVFARRVRSIQQLKAVHRTALACLDELFASLQHRAFRGDLALTRLARASSLNELCVLEAAVGLEALIFVAKRMPAGRHHHYKSLKALYFADKRHLEKHGRLIYGETHSALPHGPVPQAAYDATRVLNGERLISDFDDEALRAGLSRIKDDQQDKLVPLRDADFSKLGRAERESLEWAVRYCAGMSFEQVKAASHDAAYGRTQPNKPIPLEYLADMLPAEARERHWAR